MVASCFGSCFTSKHLLDQDGDFPDNDEASFHSAGGASVASFATMASYRTAVGVIDVASPSRSADPAAAEGSATGAVAALARRSTAALRRAFEAAAEAQQRTAGSNAPDPPAPQEVERAVEKLLEVLEERSSASASGENGDLEDVDLDLDLDDAASVAVEPLPAVAKAASSEPATLRRGGLFSLFSKKKKKQEVVEVEEEAAEADEEASVAPSISVSQHLAAEQEEEEGGGGKELELVAAANDDNDDDDDGASSCASTPQVADVAKPAAVVVASAATLPADAAVTVRTFGAELTNKSTTTAAAASSSSAPSSPPKAAAAAPRTMSVRERAAAIERAA